MLDILKFLFEQLRLCLRGPNKCNFFYVWFISTNLQLIQAIGMFHKIKNSCKYVAK
jgi:hypothetical protein